KQATDIVKAQRLFPVTLPAAPSKDLGRVIRFAPRGRLQPAVLADVAAAGAPLEAPLSPQAAETPAFLGTTLLTPPVAEKVFRISTSAAAAATLRLAGDATANVKSYLQAVSVSEDLALVHAYDLTHVDMVAYLPTMYFFVIPMAIGDCLAGLGNY